jgi:hypothetical protein
VTPPRRAALLRRWLAGGWFVAALAAAPSCGGSSGCKTSQDCQSDQRCDPIDGVCYTGCDSDDDCAPRSCLIEQRRCSVVLLPRADAGTSTRTDGGP